MYYRPSNARVDYLPVNHNIIIMLSDMLFIFFFLILIFVKVYDKAY